MVPISRVEQIECQRRFGALPAPSPAVPVLGWKASDDEWKARRRAGVGASEVAAVLGISPYASRFSLWWAKDQGWDLQGTPEMAVALRMEPLMAELFGEQSPDAMVVTPAERLYRHEIFDHMLCTPDRLAIMPDPDGGKPVLCTVELKTDEGGSGWGAPGEVDAVPLHHYVQAVCQARIMGAARAYVARFRRKRLTVYPIDIGPEARRLFAKWADECSRFVTSLQVNLPPDVDGHEATTDTLKRLYPLQDQVPDLVISAEMAADFRTAEAAYKLAEQVRTGLRNRLRFEMQGARRVLDPAGGVVVTRNVYKRHGYTVPTHEVDELRKGADINDDRE